MSLLLVANLALIVMSVWLLIETRRRRRAAESANRVAKQAIKNYQSALSRNDAEVILTKLRIYKAEHGGGPLGLS